ncbi:MAG: D-glycero-beta-D-manno-heptose 1-phosphate adenylyltransferase [Bdellovibrionaceae bacterium]|jgi:D-beta-D-heptose 7-phosphate kinase/D-beta-D-heptose 1-phosphate adenosyltransferase|nr:D-glycero-beta-D-manno-heptose 1-phosphate adenylyltransferase [Pseudobdellovibrionaceae bacterium]
MWIQDRKHIEATLGPLRSQKKIVFTNGCFDLLHLGHVKYLEEAKSLGDLLVVGINSDASVRRLKGPERPLQTEEDRAQILDALKAVDYVIIFEEDTPYELIKQVRPHILVKGGDWPVEKMVGYDLVTSWGGEARSLSFIPNHSTTSIVQKILKTKN